MAIQVGADQDDLTQEGLINVWQTLQRGVTPSADIIEARMRDYVRYLGAQQGRNRRGEPLHYDEILPLEDFRGLEASRG